MLLCIYRFKIACRFHHVLPKNKNIILYTITITIRRLIIISYYHLISSSYSNCLNHLKMCFITSFGKHHPISVQKLPCLWLLTVFYSRLTPSPAHPNKTFFFPWSWHWLFNEIRPVAFYIVLHSGFFWLFACDIFSFVSLFPVFSLNWEISWKAWLY